MHPNLKKTVEDYQINELPKAPELKCPHCGDTMDVLVKVYSAQYSPQGNLDLDFSAKYYCPETKYFKKLARYETIPISGKPKWEVL